MVWNIATPQNELFADTLDYPRHGLQHTDEPDGGEHGYSNTWGAVRVYNIIQGRTVEYSAHLYKKYCWAGTPLNYSTQSNFLGEAGVWPTCTCFPLSIRNGVTTNLVLSFTFQRFYATTSTQLYSIIRYHLAIPLFETTFIDDSYNAKHDRNCRYHVILKRVHVTIVAMKKQ